VKLDYKINAINNKRKIMFKIKNTVALIAIILLALSGCNETPSGYNEKGKLRIAADKSGAVIYVDGEKKAMVGDGGSTNIILSAGDHKITLEKVIDDEYVYRQTKEVFVGAESSTKLKFKLIKELKDDDSIKTFRGHTYWVQSVAISPNGKYIASFPFGLIATE
jgi:WD40 repeat protein